MTEEIEIPCQFEARKTYLTRSGGEAFIYCTDAPSKRSIHGRISGLLEPKCWTLEGYYYNSECESPLDITPPKPERIEQIYYCNVLKNGLVIIYPLEKYAKRYSKTDNAVRIAVKCKLIEID